ncbi:hypothetical protein HMF8227_02301 [Saliniradius amylolyticus]|uniref:DUF3034 domain-containing protein n=1 Tax=Saliniradius amylolyticus TaxID=2183582 RepID=A0A2S2E528_9ALTE|nr:DUF3034 family protein [Saliniradius amylolyticus]AWL12754.1 hypothetical protein HMF8227_02301 [Saliniradius amylolyticus]
MRHSLSLLLVGLLGSASSIADTGSQLLATGGITGVDGSAGGGITPWAVMAGYASQEEIQGAASLQHISAGDYQINTLGAAVTFYDRVELSLQRQSLEIGSGVVGNTFSALTSGAIQTAPGTDIEQDIVGLKVKLFGDAVFSPSPWLPQVAAGLQYRKNHDFDQSLAISDGSVPLPNTGVPMLLGATEDSGTDLYLSATKLWLGGAWGNNLLANVTARMTKANTLGLLGFESATEDSYQLQWEGSLAVLPSPNTAIGFEWRTQPDNLTGLGEADTIKDIFVAYFPDKHWSLTAAYTDLGKLPFDDDPTGFYLSLTVNL